jgi:ABC-2 type transport system ATP-binding protein
VPVLGATLIVDELVKTYGRTRALDGFSLRAEPGEIVGLVGHNGAGKTTFVEVASGLISPDSGTVVVAGHDAGRQPRHARGCLAVSPQETALYPSATVREHLRLFAALAGLHRGALRRAVAETAEALQVTDVLDKPVGLLSGGQRRRTQAATALVAPRPLLLLDEPTVGADPQTRQALLSVVAQRAAAGAAIVYTTHYLPELTELGATLAVARAGRIIARGSQQELLAGLSGEVRVGFGGPVPAGLHGHGQVAGAELRVTIRDPAATLAQLIAAGASPAAVDIRRPGLDDLYRSLATEENANAA